MSSVKDGAPGKVDEPGRMTFGSILAWSVWIGLMAGTIELAIFWMKCRFLDPRNMNVSRHLIWMFPMAGLIVVGVPGLILAAISRFAKPSGRPAIILFGLLFVASVGVLFRAPVYTSVCGLLALGLAWRTSTSLARRFDRLDPSVRAKVWVPLGLLGLTVAASFGRETWLERAAISKAPAVSPGSMPKNLILIVLDTVRADRLSLYGYDRDTTPNIAKLASRGVRFDRAFSTAPWTAPSHASLFTGRWPHEMTIGWDRPLDATQPTLAEALSSRGYSTAGFVANTTYCSYETGLDRGFARYEDYDVTGRAILLCSSLVERTLNFVHKHPGIARKLKLDDRSAGDRKDAARINRDFLGWLEARDDPARPFFAFLNFYDVHHPYLSPEPETGAHFGRKPESPADVRLLKTWWERDKRGIKPKDVELARDSYDHCLAYLDDQLGRLFDDLEKRGILDQSLVIITADHGEHLGEHELFGHGTSVYRPELHVPLVMVGPGSVPGGLVIEHPVSLRDVPATALELLGHAGTSPFPGRSLARSWGSGRSPDPSGVVLSEIEAPPDDDPNRGRSPAARGPMTSIVDRQFHYIRGGDGREELYDLEGDPVEKEDLAPRPERAATLGRFRASLPR